MIRSMDKLVLIAATCLFFSSSAIAQQWPRDGRDRGRWDGRDRDRPSMNSPEDRERFYDRMVESHLERLTRTYELTDQQQVQARAQLEQLRDQHRATSEPRRQEFESIREEFRTMRESGQFDRDRARELRERMRGAWQQSPLLNRDHVAAEVEKLLPADQAARGRIQRESEAGDWQQRREQMRQRWEERRQQDNLQQVQPEPQAQQEEDGDSGRRRWSGDRRERGARDDGSDRRERWERWQQSRSSDQQSRRPQQRPPVDDPTGSWERYVRDFVRWYSLDASQQATAESVLRAMLENRTNYERASRTDFDAARSVADRSDRQQRLSQLDEPVVRMFGELKAQLARIPSAAQVEAVGNSTSTRPAAEPSAGEDSSERRRGDRNREGGDRRGGRERGRDTRGT